MPNTSDKYITDNKLAAANKSPSLSKKQTVPSREDGTVGNPLHSDQHGDKQ